jgi:hypothetical protein
MSEESGRQHSSEAVGRILGIPKLVSDEPGWRWFADSVNYLPVLSALRVSRAEYEEALSEFDRVFPPDWATEEARSALVRISEGGGGIGAMRLTGHAGFWLEFHPVALLTAMGPDWTSGAAIIHLGLALARTARIPGTSKIRSDLRDLRQFPGALFELEVLSHAVLASLQPQVERTPDFRVDTSNGPVWLELTRRTVPAAFYVLNRTCRPFRAKYGQLSIEIRDLPGDAPDQIEGFISTIRKAIEELESADRARTTETSAFKLAWDPSANAETHGTFGEERTVAAELARVVRIALKDKAKHPQVKAVG